MGHEVFACSQSKIEQRHSLPSGQLHSLLVAAGNVGELAAALAACQGRPQQLPHVEELLKTCTSTRLEHMKAGA